MGRERMVLLQLLDILQRRRAYAASCFLFVLIGTALATFTAQPTYRARAIVQIEQPSGFVLRTDVFGAGLTRTLPQEQAELIDTYPFKLLVDSAVIVAQHKDINLAQYRDASLIRTLFEHELCDTQKTDDVQQCIAAHAARLEARPPNRPKDQQDFEQDIRARLIEDTGLIELFAESSSPRRAQYAANAAALAIAWHNEQLRREEARNTVRFIREQLEAPGGVRAQLVQADEAIANFKRQKVFLDANEEMRALTLQMMELSNQQWQGNLRMTDLRTRLAATRQRLGQEPSTLVSPTIYENPTVQEIKKQLVTAEADLLALQAQFTDEHPQVQSATSRVDALRDRLRHESLRIESVQRLPNPVYQELYKSVALLSADIVGQEAQMTALKNTIDNIRTQMLNVPELEKQFTQLVRQRQALERRYLFLMERLQEAELTQAVKLGNARVVELAQLPGKRVKPRRILNMLLGGLVGMLMAVGFALLLEQLDRRLPSVRHVVDWLDVPLLGTVPSLRDGADAPVLKEPTAVEAFRNLRTAVRFAALSRPVRTLIVTSPSPNDGKTFVARHLAVSMAQAGQRVVLVDADLRLPTQHRFDGVSQSPGLTDMLLGESGFEQCLRSTGVEGLWLLPAGIAPPNPTELLESARMQELLDQLTARYDVVILDVPPTELFADARVLALFSDALVMVVQPGATPRDAARNAVESFRSLTQVRLLGVVANRVQESRGDYERYYPVIRRQRS